MLKKADKRKSKKDKPFYGNNHVDDAWRKKKEQLSIAVNGNKMPGTVIEVCP